MLKKVAVESAAEAYLELLAARGVEYFFANAGTDFAPIIEAYAKRAAQGQVLPRPLTVPHEITAVGMAHGYAMVTGRPQVVMVHVIVGTANALGGIINAARAHAPILVTAGRTPLTEDKLLGARNRHIHWGQESFDQGAMVREFVKWDYELRMGGQLETVVDRALAIARSEPQGPVYLTLPREVLSERLENVEYFDPARLGPPAPTVAETAAVERTAELLATGRNPIAIVKSSGRDPDAVAPMVALAEAVGMPVFDQAATHLNFPQDHPLYGGTDPTAHLTDADPIVVVEADAPWFPALRAPRPEATIIQIGHDPLFSRYPIRGFAVDVGLAGAPRLTLAALAAAVQRCGVAATTLEARGRRWQGDHRKLVDGLTARIAAVRNDTPIDMAWLSRCVAEAIDDETIVLNEYDLDTSYTTLRRPGSYFSQSPASGLGWGLGAALGAKLAAPDKTVVCCVGDGAYIFGTPTAAHWTARAHNLPVLTVIFNNRAWNAVKRSVTSHAPQGWAMRTGSMPMSELDPAPDYEAVARACGHWAERVEDAGKLPGVIREALRVVREDRRPALLNVICKKPTP
jgi:acetolactate synthase I/II/III large subunit